MIKKNYSINLDIELKSKLDAIAKENGKSSSSIVGELIQKYIDSIVPPPPKIEVPPEKEMTKEDEQEWMDRMEKKHKTKKPEST